MAFLSNSVEHAYHNGHILLHDVVGMRWKRLGNLGTRSARVNSSNGAPPPMPLEKWVNGVALLSILAGRSVGHCKIAFRNIYL